MRMTGRISVQFSVPMDVEIAGDDIEANLELEAFKLLKLDDVQKANIDMDIITDEMRKVVPARWIFWRQHCLGCIGKDSIRRMAVRMFGDDERQALDDVTQYVTDQWQGKEKNFIRHTIAGAFDEMTSEDFAMEMLNNLVDSGSFDGEDYGLSIHIMNGAPYPDVADAEEED